MEARSDASLKLLDLLLLLFGLHEELLLPVEEEGDFFALPGQDVLLAELGFVVVLVDSERRAGGIVQLVAEVVHDLESGLLVFLSEASELFLMIF